MSALFRSYFPYEHKLGETQRILITETATDGVHLVGHNKYYEQILVEKREELFGKMVDVKIVRTGKFFQVGATCRPSLIPCF